MSWPVPTFQEISHPEPFSLRKGLLSLLVIAAAIAGAVLLLWPKGQSTQGFTFWGLLIGAPLLICGLAFSLRLNRWEREKTVAEEAEREQQRLTALWQAWSRRHVRITVARALLPTPTSADQWVSKKADLPVNQGRALRFIESQNKDLTSRCMTMFSKLAGDLQTKLANQQTLSVKLLLDQAEHADGFKWEEAATNALREVAPNCNIHIAIKPVINCAAFLAEQVDLEKTPAQLIIAAQLSLGDKTEQAFSEGVAALFIESSITPSSRAFRPMSTTPATLGADLQQLMQMQTTSKQITHAWFTGCDNESTTITAALASNPDSPLLERSLDHIVGKPGPVSNWIALAAALEASQAGGLHLVAWREPDDTSMSLCMVDTERPEGSTQ